jgi:hypothetical protein
MVKIIHKVCTFFVMAIGIIHTAATFLLFKKFSESAVWFAGAGLGAIFLAFLNMSLWNQEDSQLRRSLIVIANVLFGVWLILALFTSPKIGFPQLLILSGGEAMVISAFLIIVSKSDLTSSGK